MSKDFRRNGNIYRADIDGLRAIAIAPVVLYHASIPPFSGGFVGVDVFFVISGYLITSLIVAQIDSDDFSLRDFYLRRIRRIFPALFLMMAFCSAVGWLWLMPEDYNLLGQSIFATVLFSSNILFWRQSGYFDAPLGERPLLHTWSLGVEEQFYVAFPIFLILICRYFPRARIKITLVLCLLSFALNILTVKQHPAAAFYLAPPRVWELFIGALLAMGVVAPSRTAIWREAACIIGVSLIGGAVFGFSNETSFPGFAALLPTLGAALIIWGGSAGRGSITRLLSHPGPVFVGKISYSLYLWHFPLLAFGSYIVTPGLSLAVRIALVALSIILAVGSWLYVEQPVRQSRWIFGNTKAVFGAAAAAIVLFGSFGFAAHFANGFPSRMDREDRQIMAGKDDSGPDRYQCFMSDPIDIIRRPPCRLGTDDGSPPQFALWGDSHAESLRVAVGGAAERARRAGLYIGSSGCIPQLSIERKDIPQCRQLNDAIFRYLVSIPSIEAVILSGRWGLWAEGSRYKRESGTRVRLATASGVLLDNREALAAGLERVVAELIAAGKKVWLIGPIPEIGYNVPRSLHNDLLGIAGIDIRPTLEEFNDREGFVVALFAKIARKYSVGVIWPHEVLCDTGRCQIQRDGRPLYVDEQHLTRSAARSISTIFDPIFVDALGQRVVR
jgi:peptidoglycan/LPS O-acetylase OafA/YrhL